MGGVFLDAKWSNNAQGKALGLISWLRKWSGLEMALEKEFTVYEDVLGEFTTLNTWFYNRKLMFVHDSWVLVFVG